MIKRWFLWGMYKKRGLGLLGAKQKERNNKVRIKMTVGRWLAIAYIVNRQQSVHDYGYIDTIFW